MEEVDTVVTSEIAGTDVVVHVWEDAHRDGVRDEDDEQTPPPTTSVEEVDTVAAC